MPVAPPAPADVEQIDVDPIEVDPIDVVLNAVTNPVTVEVPPDDDQDGDLFGDRILDAPDPERGADVAADAEAPAGNDPAPDAAPAEDEPDGMEPATIARSVIRARRAAAEAVARGQSVTAVMCARSHPNPPHYDRCRHCQLEILDRTLHTIDRPVLGTLRFADGHTEPLDQHLVLGRSPAAGLLVNGEPARPVVVASPDGGLSRTHAVVQIEGWQVLVVDRDSLNNTFVTIPGRSQVQLRPGEPEPIPPGTVVNLGDETEFTYDVP